MKELTTVINNSAAHIVKSHPHLCNTGNDRYSGLGYSGIDRYSGTKTPDGAILFTVSGITAIVEQKFRKFQLKFIDPN